MQMTQNKTHGRFVRNYIHGEGVNLEHVSLSYFKIYESGTEGIRISKQNEPSLI
jgi:hypothetical protein